MLPGTRPHRIGISPHLVERAGRPDLEGDQAGEHLLSRGSGAQHELVDHDLTDGRSGQRRRREGGDGGHETGAAVAPPQPVEALEVGEPSAHAGGVRQGPVRDVAFGQPTVDAPDLLAEMAWSVGEVGLEVRRHRQRHRLVDLLDGGPGLGVANEGAVVEHSGELGHRAQPPLRRTGALGRGGRRRPPGPDGPRGRDRAATRGRSTAVVVGLTPRLEVMRTPSPPTRPSPSRTSTNPPPGARAALASNHHDRRKGVGAGESVDQLVPRRLVGSEHRFEDRTVRVLGACHRVSEAVRRSKSTVRQYVSRLPGPGHAPAALDPSRISREHGAGRLQPVT